MIDLFTKKMDLPIRLWIVWIDFLTIDRMPLHLIDRLIDWSIKTNQHCATRTESKNPMNFPLSATHWGPKKTKLSSLSRTQGYGSDPDDGAHQNGGLGRAVLCAPNGMTERNTHTHIHTHIHTKWSNKKSSSPVSGRVSEYAWRGHAIWIILRRFFPRGEQKKRGGVVIFMKVLVLETGWVPWILRVCVEVTYQTATVKKEILLVIDKH